MKNANKNVNVSARFPEALKQVWESVDGINKLNRNEIETLVNSITEFLEHNERECDVDTLLKLLHFKAEGLTRCGKLEESLLYYHRVLEISTREHRLFFKIKAVNGIAVNHMMHGRYPQGIETWEGILEEVQDPRQKADICNNLGIAYAMDDQFQKALHYHYQSLGLDEELGLEQEIGTNYVNLANAYWRLNQREKCLELYQKAIEIFQAHQNMRYLASAFGNMSMVYTELGDYRKAMKYALLSLDLKQKYANAAETAITLASMGSLYRFQKKYPQALDYLDQALQIFEQHQDFASLAGAKTDIGWVYYEMGNLRMAARYAKQSFTLCQEQKNPTLLMGNYKLLYRIESRKNNHKTALKYHEKFMEAYISIFKGNPKLMVAQSEVDYYRRKIDEQSEKYRLANIELNEKNRIISHKSEQLNAANTEQKRHLDFLSKLVSVIAHDIRGPISSVSQALKMIRNNQFTEVEVQVLLEEMTASADSSIGIINDILFWIKNRQPETKARLCKTDIIPILHDATTLYENMVSLRDIHLYLPEQKEVFAMAEPSFLKIIFRNLLHNAIKFSPISGEIRIQIRKVNKKLHIDFIDHGCGISNAKIKTLLTTQITNNNQLNVHTDGGFGIRLCRDFLNQSNGKLAIESKSNQGSTFTVILPAANI